MRGLLSAADRWGRAHPRAALVVWAGVALASVELWRRRCPVGQGPKWRRPGGAPRRWAPASPDDTGDWSSYLGLVRARPSPSLLRVSGLGRPPTPTLLQAAQRRLALALGMRAGLEGLADDVIGMVGARVAGEVGLAHATAWARCLSYNELQFAESGAVATRPADAGRGPAACVEVPRQGAAGFVLAVVVEELPDIPASVRFWEDSLRRRDGFESGSRTDGGRNLQGFSFGVGRAMPQEGAEFGGVEGTCGLGQRTDNEALRIARANDFGRREGRRVWRGRSDTVPLRLAIRAGTRLALQLSQCSHQPPPGLLRGVRTARFFVDGEECATFTDIEDDGGAGEWVAGVTLSADARVRIVPPEGAELSSMSSTARVILGLGR